jgi:hypothetical protein
MSRVWLASTWAKSGGIIGGAGRWVSLSSPLPSPSLPSWILAPFPEAAGAVLSEAICQRKKGSLLMHMSFFATFLFHSPSKFITSIIETIDYSTPKRHLLKRPQTP